MRIGPYDRISILIKKRHEIFLSVEESPASQEEFSPRITSAGTLTLDFLAYRTVTNKYLLYKSSGLWCSVVAAQAKTML